MMTPTGSIATTFVFLTLAAANASGESPVDRVEAVTSVAGGTQGPDADAVGAVGHRRTLALHKKRKRRKPAGSAPGDSGTGQSSEPEKAGEATDAGDETPVSAEPESRKKESEPEKASDDGDTNAKKAAADESEAVPETKKKKTRMHDKGGAGDETSAQAAHSDDAGEAHPEALAIAVGPRVMARSLTYAQDIYARNQRYSLPAAPMVALSADFYPAALFTDGFAANLGVTADVGYLLPVVSTPPPSGPGSYGARSLSWSGGAKVRLPGGIFATVAYGDQRYELSPTGGATGIQIPTVEYKFVRGGAGIRYLATSTVSLMANVAYLHCLSLGPIGAAPYYPKGTGAAFETGVAVGYRVTSMVEARGGIDVRRYGLAFHQNATDPDLNNAVNDPTKRIAGGAIDQYISTWVALAVVMDGYSSHVGAGAHHPSATHAAPHAASDDQ